MAEALAASATGIAYPNMAAKPDDEVYATLFPGRSERESVYEQSDWTRGHRELARVGVTLCILHGGCTDAKIQRLVKRAGPRSPQADPRTIDLAEERGLDRGVIAGLDTGDYAGQRLNIAFQGATESGTFIYVLVKSACRGTLPHLLRAHAGPHRTGGDSRAQTRRFSQARAQVLHVCCCSQSTNGSCTSPTTGSEGLPPELMELRYDNAGTAFANQSETKE